MVVDNLPPGKYYLSQDLFRYNAGQRQTTDNTVNLHYRFTLEPGTATVLGYRFIYLLFEEGSPAQLYMNREWRAMSQKDYESIH